MTSIKCTMLGCLQFLSKTIYLRIRLVSGNELNKPVIFFIATAPG